jgi:hypothetical protein
MHPRLSKKVMLKKSLDKKSHQRNYHQSRLASGRKVRSFRGFVSLRPRHSSKCMSVFLFGVEVVRCKLQRNENLLENIVLSSLHTIDSKAIGNL